MLNEKSFLVYKCKFINFGRRYATRTTTLLWTPPPRTNSWVRHWKYNHTYFHDNDDIVIIHNITLDKDNDLATVFINTNEAPSLSCKINDCEQMQRYIERINASKKLCPGTGIGKERSKACPMYEHGWVDNASSLGAKYPLQYLLNLLKGRNKERAEATKLERLLKSESVNRILTTRKRWGSCWKILRKIDAGREIP